MMYSIRHCEEAKPTRQSNAALTALGLLRYARNDAKWRIR